MDREAFLKRKTQTKEVTLDDGATIRIRKLSQSEVETINRKYRGDDKALEGFRFIVSRCAVEADGTRLFRDEDQSALADVDFEAVNTIANEVMAFSGLKVEPKNA